MLITTDELSEATTMKTARMSQSHKGKKNVLLNELRYHAANEANSHLLISQMATGEENKY